MLAFPSQDEPVSRSRVATGRITARQSPLRVPVGARDGPHFGPEQCLKVGPLLGLGTQRRLLLAHVLLALSQGLAPFLLLCNLVAETGPARVCGLSEARSCRSLRCLMFRARARDAMTASKCRKTAYSCFILPSSHSLWQRKFIAVCFRRGLSCITGAPPICVQPNL